MTQPVLFDLAAASAARRSTPASGSGDTPAAVASPPLLLSAVVNGHARPKGSLKHVGRGRMVEQVKDSPRWRRVFAEAVHSHVADCGTPHRCATRKTGGSCPDLRPGYPACHAVEVTCRLWLPLPPSTPVWARLAGLLPTSRRTGDADKQGRNILDALVDAGVIRDDSQVVDLHVVKRYAGVGNIQAPGAEVTVRVVGALDRGRAVAS